MLRCGDGTKGEQNPNIPVQCEVALSRYESTWEWPIRCTGLKTALASMYDLFHKGLALYIDSVSKSVSK